MSNTVLAGGCRCGAVRYETSIEPIFHLACHCTDCQRASGGSPMLAMIYSPMGVSVYRGEPKTFEMAGGSGSPVCRDFCGDCGTPLFVRPQSIGPVMAVMVGSLDDPSSFQVEADLFMDHARAWHRPHDGARAFPRGAPAP